MAENVYIQGVGNNSNLKQWASEETLNSILTVLMETNNITKEQLKQIKKDATSSGGGVNSDDIEQAFEEIVDRSEDVEDALKELEDQTEKNKDAGKDLEKNTYSLGKAFKNTSLAFVGGMGMVAGQITKQMTMMTDLNKAGLNLGRNAEETEGGLNAFNSAALEANLSLSEFAQMAIQAATVMNQFGVKKFGAMSRQLTDDLSKLGVTSTEGAELLAEYLEQQQTLGVSDRMSSDRQRKNAVEQIKQQNLWGKTLGKSRKEMMEASKAMKESVTTNAFLNRSSENVQKAFEQMNAGLAGFDSGTSKSVMDALSNPIIQTSDLFNQLANAGMSEAANELVKMQEIVTDPNVDPMAAEDAMNDFLDVMSRQDTQLAQIIGESDAALALVQEAKKRGLLTKAQEKELASQEKQAAAAAKAQDVWKKFTKIFERAIGKIFGDDTMVQHIEDTINMLSETFEEVIPPVVDFVSTLAKGILPILGLFAKILAPLVTGLSHVAKGVTWLADQLGPAGPLALAITAFGAFVLANIAKQKYSGAVSKAVSGVKDTVAGKLGFGNSDDKEKTNNQKSRGGKRGKGGKGAGMLGGIGKGIGEFGKGIGKGIAGIFKGLAIGLTYFANPAILLGATIFAGAITVISAGLAASAAVLSLAMPLIAESLKPFTEIDPEKLKGTGTAMLSLSAGLAAFGVAMVASSGGGLLSSVADGIGSLFGADSPIDKLMEFATVGDSLDAAGRGIQGITQGLSGFGEAVDSLPDLDVLEKIVGLMNDSDPAKITALAGALQSNRSNVESSTTSSVRGANISQIDPVLDAQKSMGSKPVTVAETGTPTNKDLIAKENAINTILARQTEILEMILVNSTSQLDNVKKLRKTSEESF